MRNPKVLFLLTFSTIILLNISCKKEKFNASVSDISFSIDTLFFDTVFTEIGTATRNFKVYNNGRSGIKITSVKLENSNSVFRFNADGLPGPTSEEIEIPAGDSVFVFVEANIDPNGGNNPLIVEDNIIFSSNSGSVKMPLVAWGQDAVYIRADTYINGLPPFKVLDPNAVWTNEKPIVVYGYAVVDSLNSLSIQPGTQVHFHASSGLWIYNGGKLTAEGSIENPIVFQGDRLEAFYDEIPGQWDRIWINESMEDHSMKNCIIKNAIIGLQIETLPFSYNIEAPTSSNQISLENLSIRNHSLAGILARNYRIKAGNVAIHNCGQFAMALTGGGEYQLSHFSFVNFWNQTVRNDASVYVSNAYQDARGIIQIREIKNSYLENSIIHGSEESEFLVEYLEEQTLPQEFELRHCQITSEKTITSVPVSEIIYQDPKLDGDAIKGYVPHAGSPVINAGTVSSYPNDITGKPRDSQPDLGVFEN